MNVPSYARLMLTTAIVLGSFAMLRPAQATITIYGFEDANVPNNPGPNTTDISNTFADAYPGDNYNGVIFDDSFSVFRNTYTNNVIGTDLYGPTDGNLALTNTAGGGTANTGPNDAGIDGLNILTNQTLESVYFAPNDYGYDPTSFGADQVTVTAFNGSGDLASASLSLVDGGGNPLSGLTLLDTSSFFDPFAGNITGYRINREVAPNYGPDGLNSGGGNYVADDFTFQSAPVAGGITPEPSPAVGLGIGLLGIAAMCGVSKRRRALKASLNS